MSLSSFPFLTAKPYGLEIVANQTVLLFAPRTCTTDDRLKPDGFIQFEPEDYALFYPH